MVLDQNYINLKNQVIKAERRVLKELGFCVHFKYPHKMIVMYLQVLECERNQKLVQCAWNYMNDSFRTNVFVRYHPETIACACIYLAARQLQIPLPNNPHWFWLFDVTEDQLKDVTLTILRLYARKKANCDELEKIVAEHRRLQVEAKLKAKNQKSGNGTPNSTSRPVSPKTAVSPVAPSLPPKTKSKDDRVPSDHSSSAQSSELRMFSSGGDVTHNHLSKRRRSLSRSDKSPSDSNSKSRSRSDRSFTRSRSRSPVSKNKRYRTPPRKYRKDKYATDRYGQKEKHVHKRNKRRSYSRSRSRSFSPSPEHRRPTHKKYYRERDHYAYNHSPEKQYKKHRNHRSPSYERYEKYKR